jgi:translocation and assembly module TamA
MTVALFFTLGSVLRFFTVVIAVTPCCAITAQSQISAAKPESVEADEIDERIPYVISIRGLEKTDLAGKFKAVSLLQAGQRDKADSRGRLNRRLAEDSVTLTKLLRAEGYYAADFGTRVAPAPGPKGSVVVALDVKRGPRFKFGTIRLKNFEDEGALERLRNIGLNTDQPARAQTIIDAETELRIALPRAGYPFFEITGRDVAVDYATNTVNVIFDVNAGAKAKFGTLIFDTDAFVENRHLSRFARFKPGDNYNARDVDDFREALLATNLFGTLAVKPVPDKNDPTIANIEISGTPSKFRTFSANVGYGTREGPKVEASWQNRNLFGAEERFTILGRAGYLNQTIRADILKSNYQQRDQNLTGRLIASRDDTDAFKSTSFEIGIGIERESQRLWQKRWVYSVSAEAQIARVRQSNALNIRTFYVLALPGNVRYDATSDIFDPQSGYRISATLIPELSYAGSAQAYVVSDMQASAYWRVDAGLPITFAARIRAGTIIGAALDNISANRRFYSGGGGSVRGFDFQGVGPRDARNAPTGGRAISEVSLEARLKITETIGVVPFLDAGNVYQGLTPNFSNLRWGYGVGLRYYTSFAPVRVDIARALNRRPFDPKFTVYVSIGQSF